jgi:hypothetical protein
MVSDQTAVVALFNQITGMAMLALAVVLLVAEWRNKRRWSRVSLLASLSFTLTVTVVTGAVLATPAEWHGTILLVAAAMLAPAFVGLTFYALYVQKYPDREPEADDCCEDESEAT